MARLEVPSIVVHSGSTSVPGSMERAHPPQPLRKQKSSLEDGESGGCIHHSSHKHDPGGAAGSGSPAPAPCNNNNNSPSKGSDSSDGGSGSGSSTNNGKNPKISESEKSGSGTQPQLSRSRSHNKTKMLTRSHAMREATSPPPDPSASPTVSPSVSPSAHPTSGSDSSSPSAAAHASSGSNAKGSGHRHKDHSPTSRPTPHPRQKTSSHNHTQDSWTAANNAEAYLQASGVDLDVFIAQTVGNKGSRTLMLKIEDELRNLAINPKLVFFRFPQMSSFHRMLVHRAAAFFGMDHNLDASGNCVVVNRTKNTRVPEKTFLEIFKEQSVLCKDQDIQFYEEPRRSILKRDCASFEDNQYKSDEKQLSLDSRRSKSFEEREEEYKRARKRIFSRDDNTESRYRSNESVQNSMEDLRWNEVATWSGNEPEPPGRFLKPSDRSSSHLHKGESFESCDSQKSHSHRSSVSKSHSFGGYTGNANASSRSGPNHGQSYSTLQRGDSGASSHSNSSRMLSKQDSASSASSRVSPSSSGYKSQSQQSDATLSATPSPTATPVSHLGPKILPISSQGNNSPEPTVIWPIAAPPGSVLIDSATGQPICNADGTVYRFDPDNPLKLQLPVSGSSSPRCSPRLDEKDEAPAERSSLEVVQELPPSKPIKATRSSPTEPEVAAPPSTQPQPQLQLQPSKPEPQKPAGQGQGQGQGAHPHPYSHSKPSISAESSSGSRHLANAATSPLPSVASPSPNPNPLRHVPSQAGQPIVVPAQNVPVAYPSSSGQPQQMVPLMGQVGANPGVYPHPYPNGSYVPGYTTPDGQTFVNGYPSMPYMAAASAGAASMPPINGYVDPSTGAYVSTAGAHGGPCPPGTPCCASAGYPCPYNSQVMTSPASAPSSHPPYDQRNVESGGVPVNDLSNYMMSMNLMDQRGGGDGGPAGAARQGGQSPAQPGPGAGAGAGASSVPGGNPSHQPQVMVAGPASAYYWGPHLSSHSQGYPPVMFYLPPSSVASPPHSSAPPAASNGARDRNSLNAATSSSNSSGAGNRARNVAASFAKGAAIYQAPMYSVPGLPPAQDRTTVNGYPTDCIPVGAQQPVVYQVPTSMHSGTMPTQSYQPALYSTASTPGTPTGSVVPNGVSYYQGGPGAGDGPQPQQMPVPVPVPPPGQQSQAQPSAPGPGPGPASVPMSMSPYGGAHGYIPAAPTPPLTPNPMLGAQGAYGMPHPYIYSNGFSVYPQGSSGPAGATPTAMMRGVVRPNMVVPGMQSSPPPRTLGPKGYRGQSPSGSGPAARKDMPGPGSGDQIRFSQSYPVPMFNLTPRYMSGDMRHMGRLPYSIPSNYRAIRPFQPTFFQRPPSQPSGEALSLSRLPRSRKPTSYGPPRQQAFQNSKQNMVMRAS